jgi:hypothetical protein
MPSSVSQFEEAEAVRDSRDRRREVGVVAESIVPHYPFYMEIRAIESRCDRAGASKHTAV